MRAKSTIVTVLVAAGVVGFDFGGGHGLLSGGGSRALGGEVEEVGLPPELHGFLGVISGTVLSKSERSFELRVAKIEKTWPKNKAENPAGAIGKPVQFRLRENQGALIERLGKVKVGDNVAVGGAHREGNFLAAMETLVPASQFPALLERWEKQRREREARATRGRQEQEHRSAREAAERDVKERRDRGRGEKEGMEAEIRRLREENARLKREMEESRR